MSSFDSQDYEVVLLRPEDADNVLAEGVARAARDAYVNRLSHIPPELIAVWQEALPGDPEATLRYLQHGSAQGWYWAIAMQRGMGHAGVLGSALCIVKDGEVFVAEVFTHPEAQHRGVARATLAMALRAAAAHPSFESRTGIQTMLNVIRQHPEDSTEYPAVWYRQLGYIQVGTGEDVGPDGYKMPTARMRAPVSIVLEALGAAGS